jgi:hypothetical protein
MHCGGLYEREVLLRSRYEIGISTVDVPRRDRGGGAFGSLGAKLHRCRYRRGGATMVKRSAKLAFQEISAQRSRFPKIPNNTVRIVARKRGAYHTLSGDPGVQG